jgi:hypothetical protein
MRAMLLASFICFLVVAHGFNILPGSSLLDKTCHDMQHSPNRFDDNGEHAYKHTREVGLGGGIEYAFASTFCKRMQQNQRDRGASCAELKIAVHKAFDVWSDRHPSIYFRPVKKVEQAEVIIGAYSRAAIMFYEEFQEHQDKEIQELHRKDTFETGDLSAKHLKDTLAFAQPLQDSLQNDQTPKRPIKLTNGKSLPENMSRKRYRYRIMVDSDNCFYMSQNDVCADHQKETAEASRKKRFNLISGLGVAACALVCQIILWQVKAYQINKELSLEKQIAEASRRKAQEEEQKAEEENRKAEVSKTNATIANEANRPVIVLQRQESALNHTVAAKRASEAASKETEKAREHTIQSHIIALEKERESGTMKKNCVYAFLPLTCVAMWFIGSAVHKEVNCKSISYDKCSDLHSTLAHEMGHVLGIGHSDLGSFLSAKGKALTNGSTYIPIDSNNVCKGLQLFGRAHNGRSRANVCDSLVGNTCRANPACVRITPCFSSVRLESDNKGEALTYMHTCGCQSRYHAGLMASHASRTGNVNRLTEDDIAALYFLYPIKNRQKKWSRHVPYKYMRKSKLHWIARKLRVKIEESAARPQIANTICKSLAQQGVDRLSHLGSAKLSSMVFDWGWVRQQSATEKEAAANHSARIQMLKAKTQALLSSHSEKDTTKQKDALDEYYLAKNNVDEENERMPNIVGRVGDLNNDGVDDRDDDGDGLPNEIEAGLEALHEMLEDNALTEVLAELQETDETRKLSNDEEL